MEHYCEGCGNDGTFADDDLVITGISGRFPKADNMEELKEILFNKRSCVVRAEDRWSSDLPGYSNNYAAVMKSLDKFDFEFFGLNALFANEADPQNRILLEVSHECITDSGYDPTELSGKNIGVFIGGSDSESCAVGRQIGSGHGTKHALGYVSCMICNRLSYRYNFIGPSFFVDAACSSSGVALEDAFRRLKDGTIEGALVGGCALCLHPQTQKSYVDMGILSPTGECCPYDANANGCVRGEATAIIFIQKKKDARRIYAKIHNVECTVTDYESTETLNPSSMAQSDLLRKAYQTIGMDPTAIGYLEGHGIAIPEWDQAEVNSIDEVFCKDRKEPILLGAMKSNIGDTKGASAICSIAKVILAFETGEIAPSINYVRPNPKCPSLTNGKVKAITESTPYNKPLAAINNFALGGTAVHIILERSRTEKNPDVEEIPDIIPKLVVYAATTERSLTNMFNHFHETPLPREFFALLNKSAYTPTLLASYRGFTIIKKDTPSITAIEHSTPIKRQIWYVVTGMGCQWPGMGLDLMELDVFAESMRKSAKVLEPFGIDLLELLKPNKDYLLQDRRITPASVTIAAIQIALVDVLKALCLEPDGIIGHSTGELVCAYADGCCTAEQTILSAYYRGAAVESTDLPRGAMAAVGLTWEEAKRRCPEGVFPACHNAEDSVTISGSREAVEKFVEQLKSEKIFARIVNVYGYAFHCKTISAVTEKLRKHLQEVYTDPKPRSKRWLSTSYCEKEWNEPGCQIADANYYCHNLESEVHFMEVLSHIPANAITIEIGPHFLLQSILKRAIGDEASYIGLMKRNENNVDFLLSSIGKLYCLGLDPQVENLYQPVSYPVPRGTPMISPLIQWDHTKSFHVPKFALQTAGNCKLKAFTSSADFFLLDHCIEGRSLFPGTGYIYLAWKALSESINKPMEAVPICIENFKIMRATILSLKDDKDFVVSILNKAGDFEIVEGGSIVATGKIFVPKSPMFEETDQCYEPSQSSLVISGPEIYNELKIHGYEYGPAFRGLLEVNLEGTEGLVKWSKEWISFLDSLLLFFGIIYGKNEFKLPTGALSVKIDPRIHSEFVSNMKENGYKGIPVKYDQLVGKCTAPGVEILKLKLEPAPHRSLAEIVPTLEEYSFIPYCEDSVLDSEQREKCESYIQVCCHVAKQVIHRLNINGPIQRMLEDVKLNPNIDLHKYFESTDESNVLLRTLQNISEMSLPSKLASKIEEEFQKISSILFEEMFFKSMLSEKPLRTLLDVAAENCLGKMTVTEWCKSDQMLMPEIHSILKSFGQVRTSCTLIHSQTAAVDDESLSEKGVLVQRAGEGDVISEDFIGSCHLGVTCFIQGFSDDLRDRIRKVSSLVKKGGFVLIFHKHELTTPEKFMYIVSSLSFAIYSEAEIERLFSEENLLMVSKKSNSFGVNAYLLRKAPVEAKPAEARVVKLVDAEYDQWVEDLKKAMAAAQEKDSSDRVVLVAQDTPVNGIIGMVNCLKQEPGGDKISCQVAWYERDNSSHFIPLSTSSLAKHRSGVLSFLMCIFTDSSAPTFDLMDSFYSDVLKKNLLMNVYMNGCWGSFRHTSLPDNIPQELMDCAYTEITKIGDLSSLKWLESPEKYFHSSKSRDELYHVYYTSLNFKDVMIATGKLSAGSMEEGGYRTDRCQLGFEFSGRDENGSRIMAMAAGGAICNTIFHRPWMVVDVPDNWSLEEAATVPVVYSTCYYALILRGELEQGERILIHSGTGGVGQAAIRIALSMDCEVFTTVGTSEKRDFLMRTFPCLKPENIGCSRDTSFEEMVMRQTKGEGVDAVLNSLTGDKFEASVRCLADHGRFLEIGKYDLYMNNPLGLRVFLKGISFHGVQMDIHFLRLVKSDMLQKEIQKLLIDGIRKGVVQPLNTTVFPADEAEKAFRYMGSGKHIGKVLLKVREEESERVVVPRLMQVKAYRSFNLYDNKSYIIIGGLGGFGIELAKFLVEKGAGTVVLTSRYGARTPYHHLCLKRWSQSGAQVYVSTLNAAKREEAKKLLEETARNHGPVGGIFNSAVVLKDAFIDNQTVANFEEVCAPKALATKYLDELTRSMCPELDMFVCFSSLSCGKGNAGQTNYGYANSVMERICEQRKRDGLHGLAIQWGIIGDVGLVHRSMGDDAMIAGVMAQKIRSCLQCLEKFLLQDKAVVSSFVTADKSRMKKSSSDILTQMAKIFGVPDIDQMNPYRTFGEMGLDSMVGVEMKQLLESTFDTTFNLQEIQDMKIDDVKKLVEEQNKNKGPNASHAEIKSINFNGPSVLLPTEAISALNSAEEGAPLFVIHSNDGAQLKLKTLCEAIARPAFALVCTKDTPMNSLKDMALWYLKQIQTACPDNCVHLASVSAAGNLALEMVLQSENQNGHLPDIRTLTLLDGSLDLMETNTTTEQEKMKNTAVYEASDLCEFLSVYSDSDLTQLKSQLELLPSLESRMNMICCVLTSVDRSAFREAAELYVKKQNLMRFEAPSGTLQKDVTAIEAAEKVLPNDISSLKSFMAQICSGQFTIHRVAGSHEFPGNSSALEVAKLFNKLHE